MAVYETSDKLIMQTIIINAPASTIWQALTVPELMNKWMAESPIEIITDWKAGSSIIIRGDWHQTHFENKGIILQFDPERMLRYTHLSSLSNLADEVENYSVIEFSLTPQTGQTLVTLTLSNFPTDAIRKHFAFYWSVAIELLKQSVAG